jgi:hypothetical protein
MAHFLIDTTFLQAPYEFIKMYHWTYGCNYFIRFHYYYVWLLDVHPLMKPPKPKSKCHKFNFRLWSNLGHEKGHGLKKRFEIYAHFHKCAKIQRRWVFKLSEMVGITLRVGILECFKFFGQKYGYQTLFKLCFKNIIKNILNLKYQKWVFILHLEI